MWDNYQERYSIQAISDHSQTIPVKEKVFIFQAVFAKIRHLLCRLEISRIAVRQSLRAISIKKDLLVKERV